MADDIEVLLLRRKVERNFASFNGICNGSNNYLALETKSLADIDTRKDRSAQRICNAADL
jgi:hypothetical protein